MLSDKYGFQLSLVADTKDQIWAHLQTMHMIPDLSKFIVSSGSLDITKLNRWPLGQIVAVPHTFPVVWKIEDPAAGFVEITQEKMTLLISVQPAWQLLRNDLPRLFERARFNFQGKIQPGQTIQADIVREQVDATNSFEVHRKGSISFMYERIPNMVTRSEIHEHYAKIDKRIPQLTCHIQEEIQRYYTAKPAASWGPNQVNAMQELNCFVNRIFSIDRESDILPLLENSLKDKMRIKQCRHDGINRETRGKSRNTEMPRTRVNK
jgi:hypothetical protein